MNLLHAGWERLGLKRLLWAWLVLSECYHRHSTRAVVFRNLLFHRSCARYCWFDIVKGGVHIN